MANLEKMIDHNEQKEKKPVIKQGPTYADMHQKVVTEAKKEDKIQRIAGRV